MTARSTTLRTVTVLAATAIAALPLAGVASAAPADRDCPDFSSQADAQAALLPGDPERLDRDNDGIACEDTEYGSTGSPATSSPSAGSGSEPVASGPGSGSGSGTGSSGSSGSGSAGDGDQITAVPSGSVDAGDGSATGGAGSAAPFVLAGFGAVAAAGAGTAVWRTRRPVRGDSRGW